MRMRALLTLLLASLLVPGVTWESRTHVHPAWEQDLHPHDRVQHDGGSPCEQNAHWHAGHIEQHPACPVCLASALTLDGPAPRSATHIVPRTDLVPRPAVHAVPSRAPGAPVAGRAPPLA